MTKDEAIKMREATQEEREGIEQYINSIAESCEDAISRKTAIDIEQNAIVDTNPSHFEAHQKFTQFLNDAEISSFGRWQWSNGFNTALTAVGIDLENLPSAAPALKMGRWITHENYQSGVKEKWYECEECGWSNALLIPRNFCPKCGAKMVEPQESKVEEKYGQTEIYK